MYSNNQKESDDEGRRTINNTSSAYIKYAIIFGNSFVCFLRFTYLIIPII